MGPESFVSAREALIGRLADVVREDDRLAALWLQGSLADGSDDPWSDVDAYIAVRDGHIEAVYGEGWDLIERAAPVLVRFEDPTLHMLNCVVAGPVKLDLFFEPAAEVGNRVRPAVRVVLDKDSATAALRPGWTPPVERAAAMVDRIFRGTIQGSLWPARLAGRGQWVMLAGTELQVLNDFLAALMAVQLDPALLFKNPFSRPRHLPPARQAELEALGDAVLRAGATRDLPAMRAAHLAILDAFFREGRAAYAAIGLAYPLTEEAEAAIRAIYRDEGQ